MSFFTRLRMALSFLFGGELPKTAPALPLPPEEPPVVVPKVSAPNHASALFLLGLLQREGRLLDFLLEDIAPFSDAEVGSAARLVHEGCKKVLQQYVPVTPVSTQRDGDSVTVPAGFDANRFRLLGNVSGTGPWKGTLKHHGWLVTGVSLPAIPTTVDVNVVAPAEVELP
jgi:hypothetical protein